MRPSRAAPPTKWPPWPGSGPSGQPQQWPFSATPPRGDGGQQRRPKLGRSSRNPSAGQGGGRTLRVPPVERRDQALRSDLGADARARHGDLMGQTRRKHVRGSEAPLQTCLPRRVGRSRLTTGTATVVYGLGRASLRFRPDRRLRIHTDIGYRPSGPF